MANSGNGHRLRRWCQCPTVTVSLLGESSDSTVVIPLLVSSVNPLRIESRPQNGGAIPTKRDIRSTSRPSPSPDRSFFSRCIQHRLHATLTSAVGNTSPTVPWYPTVCCYLNLAARTCPAGLISKTTKHHQHDHNHERESVLPDSSVGVGGEVSASKVLSV